MKNSTIQTRLAGSIRDLLFLSVSILLSIPVFAQLGWVQVPSPDPSTTRNMVRGISGTSSSDVWAVGSFEDPLYVQNDLLLHWNGNSWQQFPPMQLSTTLDDLWDVASIAVNNVWAVGAYNEFATTRAELLHYDGSAWTNHALPFIPGGSWLNAIHAVSATDIWAAGGKSGSPIRPPYVIHYNGNSWTEMIVPTTVFRSYFSDIHGTANDIWAVGHWGASYGDFHALAMHWNGSSWTNISLPSSVVTPQSEILSVNMIAPNDVWAVGYYLAGGGFNIHWDGSSWTEVIPFTGGGAYAPLSANNIFLVGGSISHWNGTTWTVVDPLLQLSYPSLASAVVFSNGEIWAGGRTVDSNNNFFSLIYRSVNHTPIFTGGPAQNWAVARNSTGNPPGNLLLTNDEDISQVLTYSVVSPPAHGTLTGFPVTAVTNNGYALPGGIGYTPNAGYTGSDQFVIRVAAGPVHSETTISLDVLIPLPIILSDFQVSKQDVHAFLKWTTESESNAQKFEVEHSIDGSHFTAIGNVIAKGNSNTAYTYNFIHKSPVPGQNFYRLKLYDMDGRTTFYPIRSVLFDAGMLPAVVLLSNPAKKDDIGLQLNAKGQFRVNLYNLQGQKILLKEISNTGAGNRYSINLSQAKAGICILTVMNAGQQYIFKVLLQ